MSLFFVANVIRFDLTLYIFEEILFTISSITFRSYCVRFKVCELFDYIRNIFVYSVFDWNTQGRHSKKYA